MSFNKLFGGPSGKERLSPLEQTNVRTPGFSLTSTFNRSGRASGTTLTPLGSPAQTAFSERFPRALSDIDTLRGTIRPGASQLREAALGALGNRRQAALSNLRGNLSRRRIAGSSFAEDALARAEREFGQAEAETEAQSFLQEFELNRGILNQELGQVFQGLQQDLAELAAATGANTNFNNISQQGQLAVQSLAAQEAGFQRELFGALVGTAASTLLGPTGARAGQGISNSIFGAPSSFPAAQSAMTSGIEPTAFLALT